jgi:hypothetical protein
LKNGYYIIETNASDLIDVKNWILSAINQVINTTDGFGFPDWVSLISNNSLHSSLHNHFSQKHNRLFSSSKVKLFYDSPLYESVEKQIGSFSISSEENSDYPQIYWRITRPQSPTDVGPFHKDSWFWSANPDWVISSSSTRYKVWVPFSVSP